MSFVSSLERVLSVPFRCFLVPVHDVATFVDTLTFKVYDEAWQSGDEPPPTDIFCPGCGFLLANTWCLQEHLKFRVDRLQRTEWCYMFAAQTRRLAQSLHIHRNLIDKQLVLHGPALYTDCSSPEHYLTRAGNAAHWVPWLLSQQVSLRS